MLVGCGPSSPSATSEPKERRADFACAVDAGTDEPDGPIHISVCGRDVVVEKHKGQYLTPAIAYVAFPCLSAAGIALRNQMVSRGEPCRHGGAVRDNKLGSDSSNTEGSPPPK